MWAVVFVSPVVRHPVNGRGVCRGPGCFALSLLVARRVLVGEGPLRDYPPVTQLA